jgi:acyl-CoA synthetase (AMP-forming)/AMP-acid ligase II
VRSEAATLVDVLRSWAARRPEQTALTFLEDGESPGHTLTYEALDQRAQEIAAGIRETVGPGERALLLYPPGLEFVTAFVGCLYAGVVPVPLYPPRNPRHFPRIDAIVADAEAGCVLTESDLHGRLSAWLEGRARLEGRSARLPLVCTNRVAAGPPTNPWAPQSDITPETLALLQYTSGSTSEPKGVMVSHGNLMANQRMIRQTFGHAEGLVAVSWLPVYHDMGLIGSLMQPLYLGGHCILMAPAAFLQKPRRWLAAISEFRAQSSGGPNFALRLCTRAIQGEQKAGLDLSGLDVLFCGSEPINASDLRAFTDAFRETGFRREAICCCYGMAEATLLVTASAPGSGPAFEPVDAEALSANVAITVATSTGQDPRRGHREVVGCGRAADGVEVVIVDHGGVDPNRTADAGGRDEHRALEDGRIGEIWLRGSHVARGYWRSRTSPATRSRRGCEARRRVTPGPICELAIWAFFVTGSSSSPAG